MARSRHTSEERQHICTEARRLQREGTRFSDICASFGLNPMTLRKWLNDEMFDRLYPKIHNQGRMP